MSFPPPASGPLLVDDPDIARWRRLAEAAGWTVTQAAALPDDPWLLTGKLVCTDDPAVAALALARGGGAAVTGSSAASVKADARRMGATVWPSAAVAEPSATVDDTDILLRELAAGRSVAAAARAAHLSVRTAQRRLDGLRKKYGVRTTAGVVTAWSREQR